MIRRRISIFSMGLHAMCLPTELRYLKHTHRMPKFKIIIMRVLKRISYLADMAVRADVAILSRKGKQRPNEILEVNSWCF